MVSEAMVKYEKAVSMRSAAQEMVDMTEQGYERKTHRCDMGMGCIGTRTWCSLRIGISKCLRIYSEISHFSMIIHYNMI